MAVRARPRIGPVDLEGVQRRRAAPRAVPRARSAGRRPRRRRARGRDGD